MPLFAIPFNVENDQKCRAGNQELFAHGDTLFSIINGGDGISFNVKNDRKYIVTW